MFAADAARHNCLTHGMITRVVISEHGRLAERHSIVAAVEVKNIEWFFLLGNDAIGPGDGERMSGSCRNTWKNTTFRIV
jgi:hypothetical protein